MLSKKSASRITATVSREPFLAALTIANACVADAKTKIDAFKCYRFKDGSVSTWDAISGVQVACGLELDVMITADRFYAYVKALECENIEFVLTEGELKAAGASFGVYPDPDFPDLLPDDLEPLLEDTSGLAAAIEATLFCVEKSAVKLNMPHGLLLKGDYVYGSDTSRAARAELVSPPFLKDVYLPVSACKMIQKLGDPSGLYCTDSKVVAFYEDRGVCYVAPQLSGNGTWTDTIDTKIESMRASAKSYPSPAAAVASLKRLARRLTGLVNNNSLHVFYKNKELTLTVADPEHSVHAVEKLEWDGPPYGFGFKVSLDFMLEALVSSYEEVDLSSLPSALRFSSAGLEYLFATHGGK